MLVLLKFWQKSLEVLHPRNLPLFASLVFKRFFKASMVFLRYFWWLLVFDFVLFFFLGDVIAKVQQTLFTPGQPINVNAVLIHLLVAVVWFVLSVGFLLTIRKPYKSVGWLYFRNGFIIYVKLALVFSLLMLLAINLLAGFGIRLYPSFHWSINLLIRLVELLTIFYWLDSFYYFKDIFISLERALNFALYNAPFFIFLFCIWFVLRTGGSSVLQVFGIDLDQVAQQYNILKFLFFFWDYFCITLLFTFYGIKKRERYSKSLFDPKRS